MFCKSEEKKFFNVYWFCVSLHGLFLFPPPGGFQLSAGSPCDSQALGESPPDLRGLGGFFPSEFSSVSGINTGGAGLQALVFGSKMDNRLNEAFQ